MKVSTLRLKSRSHTLFATDKPTRAGRNPVWMARWTAFAFMLPTFVFILGFSYYPAIRAVLGSFTQWDGFNAPSFIGVQNYVNAFLDPTFIVSLEHIFVWSMVGIPLSIIPPFIVAELIFHLRSIRFQYLYRTVFILSFVLPGVVFILVWQYIYQPSGVLDAFLQIIGAGFLQHAWLANPKYALSALMLMGFPWISPFNLLIYYAGLQAIPAEIFDATQVDGAHGISRVWRVDMPLIMAQTKLLLVLAIVGVSQNLLTPLLLTNGGPGTSTMTPVLYMFQVSIQDDQYGYGMAIAAMLFVVVMALALVNMKYFQGQNDL